MRWPPRRMVVVAALLALAIYIVPSAAAQTGAAIQYSSSPISTYPGHDLRVGIRISNHGSSVIRNVGIQCLLTLEGTMSSLDADPFTYTHYTDSYIEYGANLFENTSSDHVDLAPGQTIDVAFLFSVTAPEGEAGELECFLLQFHAAQGGWFILSQSVAPIEVAEPPENVAIDIRPFQPFNLINLNSTAPIPAAILSSPTFDASAINPDRITLAGAPAVPLQFRLVDVNWDGRKDVLLRFNPHEMQFMQGASEAVLEGKTFSGQSIRGVNRILLIPPAAPRLILPVAGAALKDRTPVLDWQPLTIDTCYRIQIDNDADFSSPQQQATVVQSSAYRAQPLANGVYYWRVQVGGECSKVTPGPWSAVWSFAVNSHT